MALMLLESERNEVLRFLSAWRNWVLRGAQDNHQFFTRSRGLCVAARYAVMHGAFQPGLKVWLGTMLIEDFGDENFPFNVEVYQENGNPSFQREISTKCAHLNLMRRAWVDAKLWDTEFPVYRSPPRTNSPYRAHNDPFKDLPPPSDYLTDPEEDYNADAE